jgi:hypothetical protein
MFVLKAYVSMSIIQRLDPSCFLGFTIDADQFEGDEQQSCFRDLTDPVIRNLCAELRPATIRIGGAGIDRLYFSPTDEVVHDADRFTIHKDTCDALIDFCASVEASLMLSFPVRNGDIEHAIRFVDYFVRQRRVAVPFLEFANEPDWGWKGCTETYPALVEAFYAAMAPRFPGKQWIAGYGGRSFPFGICYPDSAQYMRFIERCGALIDVFSAHYYVDSSNAPTSSLALLLQPGATDIEWARIRELRMLLDLAGLGSRRIAINEFNTFASQGLENVSNTMAAALWTADFIGNLARSGAYANNLQCGFGRQHGRQRFWRYAMIDTRGAAPVVNPHYYAFYLWSRFMGRCVLPVMLPARTPLPVSIHVTTDDAGTSLQVMLINKDVKEAYTIELAGIERALPDGYEVYELRAPAVDSRQAAINGCTVQEDGKLPHLKPRHVQHAHGVLRYTLRPASVVVLRS